MGELVTRRECKGDSQGAVSFISWRVLVIWVHIQFVKIHQDVHLIYVHLSLYFSEKLFKRTRKKWCWWWQLYKWTLSKSKGPWGNLEKKRMMYLLSHLRVSAAEKHNWYSETVNLIQLCGNKEFICDFKTSLRCREPDGAFINSHVILTGEKSIFGD